MRAKFWHQVIIVLGGPVAMTLASYALARVIEVGAGPVIPTLQEPPSSYQGEGNN